MPSLHYPIDTPVLPVPSKSVLLCDVPFLDTLETDMPFRSANADVPDDLLACTPIHGWDSPPESPVHVSQVDLLDGVNPMMDESMFGSPTTSPLYDWTPPGSPEPNTELMTDFSDLDAFAVGAVGAVEPLQLDPPPVMQTQVPAPLPVVKPVVAKPSSSKRKASASMDERERKRIREKQEQSRIARTQACEQAVKALASTKNDEDPESKRHTHNVLERKRRNDLKNSYQLLREKVPSLEDDDRAPTGKILLHAVDYINHLKKEEALLMRQMAQARADNERLRRNAGLGPRR